MTSNNNTTTNSQGEAWPSDEELEKLHAASGLLWMKGAIALTDVEGIKKYYTKQPLIKKISLAMEEAETIANNPSPAVKYFFRENGASGKPQDAFDNISFANMPNYGCAQLNPSLGEQNALPTDEEIFNYIQANVCGKSCKYSCLPGYETILSFWGIAVYSYYWIQGILAEPEQLKKYSSQDLKGINKFVELLENDPYFQAMVIGAAGVELKTKSKQKPCTELSKKYFLRKLQGTTSTAQKSKADATLSAEEVTANLEKWQAPLKSMLQSAYSFYTKNPKLIKDNPLTISASFMKACELFDLSFD